MEEGDGMLQCPFLTTIDEEVDCFNECALHKWQENNEKCPFVEVKNYKPFSINNIFDNDLFNEDKISSIRMLYKDRYL